VGKYSQAASFPIVLLFGVGLVASVLMILVVVAGMRRALKRIASGNRTPLGSTVD